jgi:phage/plasmid primase-like uncharacterized protein
MFADDRTLCIRKTSAKPVRGGLGGWWHFYKFNDPPPKVTIPKVKPKPVERAGADHIDGVLTTLLRKHLALNERHTAALRARGLSESELERNGYASAPDAEEGSRIAGELSAFGLGGAPGFHTKGGEWHMRDYGAGFFVPVRDERSRIAGLQLRRDEGEPRYIWFSSNGYSCGTSSGAPIHFARPHLLHDAAEVLLTEGALKADVVSYFMAAPVIAAAGVNNFGRDFAATLREKFPNLRTTIISFDSDWRTNPQVKAALEKLMCELSGAGFRVRVRTWPPEYKGLDDYLLAFSQSNVKGVAA